jgi:hypothetical protein
MFYVRHDGKLYAKDADIEGKITATSGSFSGTITAKSGYIGYLNESNKGWYISTGAIYSGPTSVTDAKAGTYIGTGGI